MTMTENNFESILNKPYYFYKRLNFTNNITFIAMKISFVFIFCILSVIAGAQSWEWIKTSTGNGYNTGYGIATDSAGNVYVTGSFNGPAITFGHITLTNSDPDEHDFFLVKYDAEGNVIWAKHAGEEDYYDSGIKVIAKNNHIYVLGTYEGASITFDNITLTGNHPGFYAVFVVKYNSNGDVVWAKNGVGNDNFLGDIAIDNNDNVYVTGEFGYYITFDSLSLDNQYSNHISSDFFMVKFDSSGKALWAKDAGGFNSEYGTGIALDNVGNVYVTGCTHSPTFTMDNITLNNLGMEADIFIAKLSPNGNLQWMKNYGGYWGDYSCGLLLDNFNNIYIGGYTWGDSAAFDNIILKDGGSFIAKCDSNGNMLWAKNSGTGGYSDRASGISRSSNGNIYMTGTYEFNTLNWERFSLPNNGLGDVFCAGFDTNGNMLNLLSIGFVDNDNGYAIATHSNYIYVAGSTVQDSQTAVFTAKINFTNGIKEAQQQHPLISVYPNPAKNKFNINLKNLSTGTIHIKILSQEGKVFYSSKDDISSKVFSKEINTVNALSGLYFVQIILNDRTITKKIILND